jgi:hypothetical protein
MDPDIEDLLRQGMERSTRDLRAPAGIARRAVRRRRRRLALRSAAGAAAAVAACAVALVAVEVPGPAVNAAYVVNRVNSALSAAEPGAIAQMTITTRGPVSISCTPPLCRVAAGGKTATTSAEEWSYGNQWRSVTYSSAGHPVYDEGFSASSVYTLVNYQARTWARQSGVGRPAASPSGSRACEPLVAALPLLFQSRLRDIGFSASSPPATVARALRTAVSCGALTVAGRQRVDGIEAIELTSRAGSLIPETIWVSPGTYLPVRVVVTWPPRMAVRQAPFPASPAPLGYSSARGTPILQETADITWLSPTAQNLAKLAVTIPAGFRRVPLSRAVTPQLPQIPGRNLPTGITWCPSPARPPATTGPTLPSSIRRTLPTSRLKFARLAILGRGSAGFC